MFVPFMFGRDSADGGLAAPQKDMWRNIVIDS
jgi:hypothetical protein